jgi:hypothetical protein
MFVLIQKLVKWWRIQARDRKVMIATKEMLSCNRLKLLESETHIGVSMWAFLFEFEKFSCQK